MALFKARYLQEYLINIIFELKWLGVEEWVEEL